MKNFKMNIKGIKPKLRFLNVPSHLRSEILNGSILLGTAVGSYGLFKLIGSELPSDSAVPVPDDYIVCDEEAIEVEVDFEIPVAHEESTFAETSRSIAEPEGRNPIPPPRAGYAVSGRALGRPSC